MLFFLKYAKSEDLALTHKEFKKQAALEDVAAGCQGPGSYFGSLHVAHGFLQPKSWRPEAHLH